MHLTDLRERSLKEIHRLRMERVRLPIVDLYEDYKSSFNAREDYKSSVNARDQLELIPWTRFMQLPKVLTFWYSPQDSFDLVAWNSVWDSIVEECTLATRKLKSDLYQLIVIAQHDRKYNSTDPESSDELEVDSNSSLPLAATSTSSTSIPPVSDPINWQVPFSDSTRRKMDSTFAQPSSIFTCENCCGAEGYYPDLIETRCRGAGGYNSTDVSLPLTHKLILDTTRVDIILHLLQLAQVKDQKSAISTLQKAGRRYTCKLCELQPLEYDTPAYDRWEGTDNFRYSAVAIPYSDMVSFFVLFSLPFPQASVSKDSSYLFLFSITNRLLTLTNHIWRMNIKVEIARGLTQLSLKRLVQQKIDIKSSSNFLFFVLTLLIYLSFFPRYLAKNQEAVADIEEEDEFRRPPAGMVSGTFVSFGHW